MKETHHPGSVPMDLRKRSATATAQWLLERAEDSNSPIYHANQIEVLICGEEGFARILQDIRRAKHSVEIICWGFDPAMELERTGNTWPRGPTWGDLLRDVAAGKYNNGKPVQVRVLCWRDGLISALARNTPGYGMLQAEQVKRIRHHERLSGKPHEAGMTPQERRDYFNALWFFDATHGTHSHLSFKVRACDSDKVRESLSKESKKIFPRMEAISFMEASTAHQKTILIDYDHAHGQHAVGYVMGLNSVTDYWDTRKHLFHDPRRGESWEGGGDNLPGLKPFQDYACRIVGEVLICVSKNFVDAWNRVAAPGQTIQRVHDLRSPPAGLKASAGKAAHRAQIVRTQPEEGDNTIQRLYRQGVLREIPVPSRELLATGLLPAPATGIWHGRIDPAHPLAKVFNQWNRQAYVEEGQPFPDPRDRGLDISPKEIEWQWLDQANQPLPSGRKAITIRNFSAEEPMAKGS
ncbi:hypothetical protein J2X56_003748 [Herbaspirillum sp. 1173]|uniref:hypothetical protein n=1 Tax=Herbaspirillum sp. 1173 TaxID=2817734 RepID=UPI0028541DE1|nr:hypothetical protein [Herbaspirillum sp. 1173]MDR6741723.1 hypothetical protein [Herbaspirillum sp. 1173]